MGVPGSCATCYLTDFNETLPVFYLDLSAQRGGGGEEVGPPPPPVLLGFYQGNCFKIGKIYKNLSTTVFNLLLLEFAHVLVHP